MNEQDRMDVSGFVEEQKPAFDFNTLLPILEDIILMVHESIRKIPHVTSNLNKITERNERVTAEILSVVDRLNDDASQLSAGILAISESIQRRKELHQQIGEALAELNKGTLVLPAPRIQELWQEYNSLPTMDETIVALFKSVEVIQNESTNVVMSLQIQDITAQHIGAINHLIESVHNRLTLILQKFYGVEFQAVIPDSSRKKLSDYIARQSKKTHSHEILPDSVVESQDEIDRMFTEK